MLFPKVKKSVFILAPCNRSLSKKIMFHIQ